MLQELYRHLGRSSCKRLCAFRGRSEGQLRVFLRRVACRFGTKLVQKWIRARKHEQAAIAVAGPPIRDGPTERQIENARKELESVMPAADREKLCQIADRISPVSEGTPMASPPFLRIPDRTIRHWRSELLDKYGNQILGNT